MPLAPDTTAPGPVADLAPPDLDDPARFVRRPRVPILDVHRHDQKGDVSEELLRLLAANTNRRCDRGDLVAITIGHTREDAAETDQPPFVGYARDLAVGTFRGEPCLLADFYLRADDAERAMGYPHRSIERVSSPEEADNYIDYVCLLRRPPERSLGLLTYRRDLPEGASVVRYERDFVSVPDLTLPASPPSTPQDSPPMTAEEIQAVATAVAAALAPGFKEIAAALAPPPAAGAGAGARAGADAADAPLAADADGPPDDAERIRNDEATPGEGNTFVPGVVPAGMVPAAELKKVQDERDALKAQVTRGQYQQRFAEMERLGVVFNRDAEMARVLALPVAHREGHFKVMRERYARQAPGAGRSEGAAPEPSEADAAAERQAIIDVATRYGIRNWEEARQRYQRDKAGSAAPVSREESQKVVDYATRHRITNYNDALIAYRRERDGRN